MKLKKIMPIICLFLIGAIFLVYFKTANYRVVEEFRKSVIREVENNKINEDFYVVSLSEITDFDWDKAVMFYPGTSNLEISSALGVDYNENIDLQTGIIFVKGSEIVMVDSVVYDTERKHTFQYYVDVQQNNSSLKLYDSEDDKVFVKKVAGENKTIYIMMTNEP